MITENLSTLKIHKLTQEQYNRALEAGNIDNNALYLTPDDRNYTDIEIDTKLDAKLDKTEASTTYSTIDHTHDEYELPTDPTFNSVNVISDIYLNDYNKAIVFNGSGSSIYDNEADRIVFQTDYRPILKIDGEEKELATLDDIQSTSEALETALDGKANASHSHAISDVSGLQSALDGKAAQTDLDNLETVVAGKANASHTHTIANITNLQSALDGKASSSHTHTVSNISDLTATATELNYMDGVTSNVQVQLDGKANATHTHSEYLTELPTEPTFESITIGDTNMNWIDIDQFDGIQCHLTSPIAFYNSAGGVRLYKNNKYTGFVFTSTGQPFISMNDDRKLGFSVNASGGNSPEVELTIPNQSGTIATLDDIQSYSLSSFGVTATASEINVLDGITATTTELNYVDGVTSNIQTQLDGKAASSHGTHVSYSTTAPVMDGTASVGSASTVARSDHKHPTDTSRASKTEFDTHVADTTAHITSAERSNWNAAKTHADSAHAPSNAEKNQNAFSNITVGSTTVAADSATDTVTFVGSNVTITPDATNDKITFAVADGSTSAKGLVQLTNSTSSTSTTTAATPSSVKSAYDLANTAKTNAATAQSKADSAYSLAESKVDSLSDLGITATTTELNYVDGVTSAIQTQLDAKASLSDIPDYITTGARSGTTIGNYATIEGYLNTGSGDYSHAEGINTTVSGVAAHAEGENTTASDYYSHAEGYGTTASATAAHAEGYETDAVQAYSHAEGMNTTASSSASHAEGMNTTASGVASHAEGYGTTASGSYSHAEGYGTTASGSSSHAAGYATIANQYQYVVGKYNADTTAPTYISDTTASAGLFIVGIGTSDTSRTNGFRINPAGKVYGTGTFGTSGADYAEYFEWFDGNPNNEDRRGHFVALEGGKIRYATPSDDYILGVVSADPSVAGDIHSESWHDMYLKDVFGSKIVEVVEVAETTDENGEIIPAHIERRWVLNPHYDPNVKYTSREERPEWAAIGIVGKLVVVDDGTCQVNGYCYPNVDGIATASQEKTNYRVMERLDDTHIRIFIK